MRRPVQRNRVMGEINITPLTDVMLVLLVIFMVTTPLLLKAGIDINLPKAHAKPETTAQPLRVSLTADGSVALNGEAVTLGDLGVRLRAYLAEGADPNVVVAADARVAYGAAVQVLDIARQAGARKLILAADPAPIRDVETETR